MNAIIRSCALFRLPNSVSFLMEQGKSFLFRGDCKGIEFFQKATQLDPNNPELLYQQAAALFEWGATPGNEKQLWTAIEKARAATHLREAFFEAWLLWARALYLLGLVFHESRYFVEAKKKCKKALLWIDLQPVAASAEAYWDYALIWKQIAYYSQEPLDMECAIAAFERGISTQHPFPSEFWHEYGLILLDMARTLNHLPWVEQAAECFRKTVATSISFFEGWLDLAKSEALIYEYTHDEHRFNQADHYFATAAQLQPASLTLWKQWASFLLESGRKTEDMSRLIRAAQRCESGYTLNQKDCVLMAIWAEVLALSGHLADRIDLIREAQNKIENASNLSGGTSCDVWHSYGQCLLSFGNYFHDLDYRYQAIEKFQEGISLNRTHHRSWYGMAEAYATLALLEQDQEAMEHAVRFYQKAFSLQPMGRYHFSYACAIGKLGELKQDQQLLQQSIHQFDYLLEMQKRGLHSHPEWLFHYSCTLDAMGDLLDESSYYQKALQNFAQLVVLHPDFPSLHLQIGMVYAHLGETTGELDSFALAAYHFSMAAMETKEEGLLFVEWGKNCIHIGQHSHDEELSFQSYLEAEQKLLLAGFLGEEEAYYFLACLHSIRRECDQAMEFLQKAHRTGTLPSIEDLFEDDWLDSLRCDLNFQQFVAQIKTETTGNGPDG